MNIAFPENVGAPRHGRRGVRLSQLLAVAYCFGGVAALVAAISKFVVGPLHDELTYERRVFADEARNKLVHLNARLARIVTPRPVLVDDYVERAVPANEAKQGPFYEKASTERIDKMFKDIRELRYEAQQLDPNDRILRTHSALTSQANELAKYIRQLQYETVPTSAIFLPPVAAGEPNKSSAILGNAIVNCTKEIRSLKSSVLS